MNLKKLLTVSGFVLLLLCSCSFAKNTTTAFPKDTGIALVNPGMGWVCYFYSNIPENYGSHLIPSDTADDFPGLSTVFMRLPWAFIEPEEGKFNWAMLDTPAQRWIDKGKKIAFCFTSSENWLKFATPEWVKKAGAKGTFYEFGKGRSSKGNLWDPFFDDPVFLKKLDNFLAAVAKRYDKNPNVEYIFVGSYGLWGEGHTLMSSHQDSLSVKKKHIDLYTKHFKKTLLAISDDYAGHEKPGRSFPITDYALSKGVTIHDDSIMVQPPPRSWFHAEMAQKFWPELPVILEHEHYGGSVERQAWKPELLLKAVEDYHASFMSIHWEPKIFLKENRDIINKINLRLGYRLFPQKISWQKNVKIGKIFSVEWEWINKGVAPCYRGGFPTITLKDEKNGIVSVLCDDNFNLKKLNPGTADEYKSSFIIGLYGPITKPGTYDVYVSVGLCDGTPVIALPLENDDGHRRYKIGKITLTNQHN